MSNKESLMQELQYCQQCDKEVQPIFLDRNTKQQVQELNNDCYVCCPECHYELDKEVPQPQDTDSQAQTNFSSEILDNAEQDQLITISEIEQITQKYNIGVRPLAMLFGWGQLTINRYLCSTSQPTKNYSNSLKKILRDPFFYQSLLEKNKKNITRVAYEKSLKAVNKIIQNSSNKIEAVAYFLIHKNEELTYQSLQKLLYVTQVWFNAFHNEWIFPDECIIEQDSPAYAHIKSRYQQYGRNTLISNTDINFGNLNEHEIQFLTTISEIFKVFSNNFLDYLISFEKPYVEAREQAKTENAGVVVPKEILSAYYSNVKNVFRLSKPTNLTQYVTHVINEYLQSTYSKINNGISKQKRKKS